MLASFSLGVCNYCVVVVICHVTSVLLFLLAQSPHAEAETFMLVLCFTVELLSQWLWAQRWQVTGVTVPSVWPRGPSAVQVTSALIWLISLMSLFLGGPTNKCDLNRQEPDGFALQEQKTQISWQLLTYIQLKLAHSFIYCVRQHEHIHTDKRNKCDDTLTFMSNEQRS